MWSASNFIMRIIVGSRNLLWPAILGLFSILTWDDIHQCHCCVADMYYHGLRDWNGVHQYWTSIS